LLNWASAIGEAAGGEAAAAIRATPSARFPAWRLSDETRGFLDADRVARIKPGAILVNTAHGALVDEGALIDALTSGRISRTGLDVFHAEPIKPDHPLAQLDNVTQSPHAAFRTPEASENLVRRALDIVRQVQGMPAV
jgi:D-3-phosphoglycerate dehydrogenase / 2-oxoglutarate reductase